MRFIKYEKKFSLYSRNSSKVTEYNLFIPEMFYSDPNDPRFEAFLGTRTTTTRVAGLLGYFTFATKNCTLVPLSFISVDRIYCAAN